MGSLSAYSVVHRVRKFTQSKALDSSIGIISALGLPDWANFSIFIMASIADSPFLYPNWLLDVRRCRILASLAVCNFGHIFI